VELTIFPARVNIRREAVDEFGVNVPAQGGLIQVFDEAADMLGVDYFSVYRLIQRGKLKACHSLSGKFLIARSELLRMLNEE